METSSDQIINELKNERDQYSRAMMEEERRANRLQAQLEAVRRERDRLRDLLQFFVDYGYHREMAVQALTPAAGGETT